MADCCAAGSSGRRRGKAIFGRGESGFGMRTTFVALSLLILLALNAKVRADDPPESGRPPAANAVEPPFDYVWGHAYHVLPGTHNSESGYFPLCEGLDEKIYVGTAKYGENSYLVEFAPKTGKQRIVIDTNKVCGLNPKSYNEAQSKIPTPQFRRSLGKNLCGQHGISKEGRPNHVSWWICDDVRSRYG